MGQLGLEGQDEGAVSWSERKKGFVWTGRQQMCPESQPSQLWQTHTGNRFSTKSEQGGLDYECVYGPILALPCR